MKRKLGWFVLLMALTTLTACGKSGEPAATEGSEQLLPLEVELTVLEKVDINETVKMEALVTQGDEKISDADEVEFEIWEEGKKEESLKIKAENEKNGIYSAEKAFDLDGIYNVQVHVTARNQHTMPKKVVTVGNVAEQAETDHGHESAEGFSMHFMELKNVKAQEEVDVVTHLQMEGKPLENVKVRYEIWNEATPANHQWVDTTENESGEYVALHKFTEVGTYKVHVHVEDEHGLHEHEEHAVVVN